METEPELKEHLAAASVEHTVNGSPSFVLVAYFELVLAQITFSKELRPSLLLCDELNFQVDNTRLSNDNLS